MAKTETNISNLKINRGTYANIQANIASIGDNELIITTDKNVPIPVQADADKIVRVDSNGEYELDTFTSMTEADIDLAISAEIITTSITHGTAEGDTVIAGTATVTIRPNDGYTFPSSVTVTGATSSYDDSTGVISLSNATGEVNITAECVAQATIINFSFDKWGTIETYEAEEGMTWGEWINSAYNTEGETFELYTYEGDSTPHVMYDGEMIYSDDPYTIQFSDTVIIENELYKATG